MSLMASFCAVLFPTRCLGVRSGAYLSQFLRVFHSTLITGHPKAVLSLLFICFMFDAVIF